MSLSDKGSPENSTFTTEKDSVKHSTSHTEIHQPTTTGVYFKSSVGSIDASDAGQHHGIALHCSSSPYHAWSVWPKQILQLLPFLKLWAWSCRNYFLDCSEGPTKAGIPSPLEYHVLPLSLPCQNMTSGRTRSVREEGGGRLLISCTWRQEQRPFF